MSNFDTILVSGSSFDDFSKSLTAAIQALPPELSKRLRAIRRDYFGWYGFEGAYKRMNERTVGEILAEYQSVDMKPLASGESDGVRYNLYEAPPSHTSDGPGNAEE